MLNSLRDFYFSRNEEIREKYQRIVPFGDTVVDRWEKAQLLGFGENTSVYDSALIFGDVSVGDNVWIGPGVVLDGSAGPLQIGSYCHISAGTQIYTHDSVAWVVTGGKHPYTSGAVTIGSCSYIGPNVIITSGVNIGEHCIIGTQSLVKHNVPGYHAAWGQPAKIRAEVILNDTGYKLRYLTEESLVSTLTESDK